MTIELHPLCTLFPRITGAEFEALKHDISVNGLRHPVVIYDGMILDGGNRYQACLELGIDVNVITFDGDNIASYVRSVNLHRRHLTPGQNASIVSSMQNWDVAQSVGRPSVSCNVAPLDTAEKRAAESGASLRTQKMADSVAKQSPELAKKVGLGEISLPAAHKQISKPEKHLPVVNPVAHVMPGDKVDYVAPETDFEQMYHDAEHDNSIYVSQIKSLNTSDKDAEIIRLSLLCDQLDGHRRGETNTKNEAQKQAKYYGDLLAKIRKVLNVDSNSKILATLEAR